MTIWTVGDRVRHISRDVVGATRGTVMASFTNLDGEDYAAVQWDGGCLALTHTKWLDRPFATHPRGTFR